MVEQKWRQIFGAKFSMCRSRELPGRFPGTPGKIPGNSGSTELRKEFGTTLTTPIANDICDKSRLLTFCLLCFLNMLTFTPWTWSHYERLNWRSMKSWAQEKQEMSAKNGSATLQHPRRYSKYLLRQT